MALPSTQGLCITPSCANTVAMRLQNRLRHLGTDGTSGGSVLTSVGGRCDLIGTVTRERRTMLRLPQNLDHWIEFLCAYVISLFVLLVIWAFLGPILNVA